MVVLKVWADCMHAIQLQTDLVMSIATCTDRLFFVSPDKKTEYLLSADVLPCMALFSYAMI